MARDPFTINTDQFAHEMNKLAKLSTRTDEEIVTFNARDILKSIVYNSPRRTGNMNAGWWSAWTALDTPGTPNTRRRGPFRQGSRRYVPEGAHEDNRKGRGEKSFTFINRAHMYTKGKRVNYPYILAAKNPNLMAGAEREIGRKFERRIARQYRKLGLA